MMKVSPMAAVTRACEVIGVYQHREKYFPAPVWEVTSWASNRRISHHRVGSGLMTRTKKNIRKEGARCKSGYVQLLPVV